MNHHLEFEHWVPFPLESVFAFFSNAENLPRIMPASTGTRLIRLDRTPPSSRSITAGAKQAVSVGSVIVTSSRILPFLPIRMQWISRIAEFEWDHYFVDIQERGPFRRWHHRHQFERQPRNGVDGTVVRDEIDYEVSFGLLGWVANRFFIAPQMQDTFAHRQRVLPELLARPTQAFPRQGTGE